MTEKSSLSSFSILRSIISPVIFLALFCYLWVWLEGNHGPGDVVGFLEYRSARKLLDCMLMISSLLLGYRLSVTMGFQLLMLKEQKRKLPLILRTMVGIGFAMVGLVWFLYIWLEGEVSGILALSGAIGVVIGLALRPIILDVFSGLSANMEAAFQIGDWVSIEGNDGDHAGWVDQINWRTTHIRTRSGNIVVCPNSYLSTSIVTNSSRPYPLSRYSVKLKLPFDVPVKRGQSILLQAVTATLNQKGGPSDLKQPDVLVTGMSGSGVEYWIRYWLDPSKESFDNAMHTVSESISRHLRMAGISLAIDREEIFHTALRENCSDLNQVESRADIIRDLEIFRGLDSELLRDVAASIELEQFSEGQSIINQGDSGTSMYILVEGMLNISIRSNEGDVRLGQMVPGEYFGEMSLLTGEERSATVACETECMVFKIDRSVIEKVMQDNPQTMTVISRNLAARKMRQADVLERLKLEETEEEEKRLQAAIFKKMKSLFRMTRPPLNFR